MVIEDSLDYFENEIEKSPENDSLWYRKGIFLIQHQSVDTGIKALEKAIQIKRKPEYYFSLSDAYLLAIESQKAESVIDSVNYYFPNNIDALLKKARIQLVLKKHMNALATLDYIFTLDPENADANYLAGHVFFEQGDTGRAIKSYQRSVDLNPEFVNGWIQLGDIMLSLKNRRAIDYYKNAIRLDSNNFETRHNLAYAMQSFGQFIEAKDLYRLNTIKHPEYELSFYNLGLILQKEDSCQLAVEFLSRAIQINSKEASSYLNRAKCFYQLGSKIRAIEDLKKALQIYPEYKEAKELIAKVNLGK